MKRLRPVLCIAFLLLAAVATRSEALAQKDELPPGLSESSTVRDILEYLNEKGFPEAHIGLELPSLWGDKTWNSEAMNYDYSYTTLVFSPGFELASAPDDCHIWLRNDDVKVYFEKNADEIDVKGLTNARPPYAAEFSVWLETVSHDKGKGPFQHTGDPKKLTALGAWRTEFRYRGFYGRNIFGIKIPALKPALIGREYETAAGVTFTFDDRLASERFNAAFRRLIKLCQPRSTKPRWDR